MSYKNRIKWDKWTPSRRNPDIYLRMGQDKKGNLYHQHKVGKKGKPRFTRL